MYCSVFHPLFRSLKPSKVVHDIVYQLNVGVRAVCKTNSNFLALLNMLLSEKNVDPIFYLLLPFRVASWASRSNLLPWAVKMPSKRRKLWTLLKPFHPPTWPLSDQIRMQCFWKMLWMSLRSLSHRHLNLWKIRQARYGCTKVHLKGWRHFTQLWSTPPKLEYLLGKIIGYWMFLQGHQLMKLRATKKWKNVGIN